jgi:RNA-directed DNA polymerase
MNQNNENEPTTVPRAIGAKQAGEAHDPWWWVERSVWTERMLTRLTSSESANQVWYSLLDKTYASANLQSAFDKVWRRGG